MAFSTTNIGTQSGIAATITVSVGSTVPSGSVVVCLTTEQGFHSAVSASGTVADSASNVYANVAFRADPSGDGVAANQAINSTTISGGGTISFTPFDALNFVVMTCFYVTGAKTTSPLDSSTVATGIGSGGPPSATSGSPTAAGELFIAVCGWNYPSGNPTFTLDTGNGWTNPPPTTLVTTASGVYVIGIAGGTQVNAGTGTKTTAPTFIGTSSNMNAAALIYGLKPTISPPKFSPLRTYLRR